MSLNQSFIDAAKSAYKIAQDKAAAVKHGEELAEADRKAKARITKMNKLKECIKIELGIEFQGVTHFDEDEQPYIQLDPAQRLTYSHTWSPYHPSLMFETMCVRCGNYMYQNSVKSLVELGNCIETYTRRVCMGCCT